MCVFSSIHSSCCKWPINGLAWEKGRRQARCLATSVGFLRLILCGNVDVGYLGFGVVRMCGVA